MRYYWYLFNLFGGFRISKHLKAISKALALVVLLFSFLVQHQLAWRNSEVSSLDSLTRAPVLLGRAVYGPEGRRKLRDV